MPLFSSYTRGKHQKTKGFLMFSGSIDREQFYETGCFDGIFALVCLSE